MRTEEGRRFERFIRERWRPPLGSGGIRGLCRAVGVTPEAMYKWFRGQTYPDMATLSEIARVLGTTRVELVAAIDNEPAPIASIREAVREEMAPLRAALEAQPLAASNAGAADGTQRQRAWWLQLARERAGLSRGQLAFRMGVTARTVQAWEERRTQPTIMQESRLAEILEVAIARPAAKERQRPRKTA